MAVILEQLSTLSNYLQGKKGVHLTLPPTHIKIMCYIYDPLIKVVLFVRNPFEHLGHILLT